MSAATLAQWAVGQLKQPPTSLVVAAGLDQVAVLLVAADHMAVPLVVPTYW